MKKINYLRKAIIGLLVVFAVLSFTPCVNEIAHWLAGANDFLGDTVEGCNYLPAFCCVISVVEVILLLAIKKRGVYLIGLLLNLVKTFVPWNLYSSGAFVRMGGLAWYEYSLSWLGYVIISVGVIISIVYIVAFVSEKAKKVEQEDFANENG